MSDTARLVALVIGSGFVLIFALQNTAQVQIELLFWSFSMSRALLVFVMFAIGLLLGWILRSLRDPGFSLIGRQ